MDNASVAAKSLYTTLGAQIAPILTGIARGILPIIAAVRNWIKEHQTLWTVLLLVGLATSGIGAAFLAVAGIIKIVTLGIGVLTAVWSALVAVWALGKVVVLGLWAAITAPITLVIAAVGALVALFLYLTGLGTKLFSTIGGAFSQIGETASTAFRGISAAIKDADWETVFKIAWTGIQAVFWEAIGALKQIWRDFSGWFIDLWHDTVHVVSKMIQGIVDTAKDIGSFLSFGLIEASNEGAINELKRAHAAETRERQRRREEDSAADQARVTALNEQVRALADAAEAAHRNRRLAEEGVAGVESAARKIDVRGTFSAAAISGLGATSVVESLLGRIADNTDPRRNPTAVFG
jgi:hypothetical protein